MQVFQKGSKVRLLFSASTQLKIRANTSLLSSTWTCPATRCKKETTTQCVVWVSHCPRSQGIDSFNLEGTFNHDRIESQKWLHGIDLRRLLSPHVRRGRKTPKSDVCSRPKQTNRQSSSGRLEKNLNHILPPFSKPTLWLCQYKKIE